MKINDALNVLNVVGQANLDDIKQAYRRMSAQYHPDKNPAGLEMMKIINLAWTVLKERGQDTFFNTDQNAEQSQQYCAELNEALQAVINLPNLEIEICGMWAWIGGDTKPYKTLLKAAGYKWAPKKAKWYYRPAEYKSRARGNWDMQDIRAFHGSQSVRSEILDELN